MSLDSLFDLDHIGGVTIHVNGEESVLPYFFLDLEELGDDFMIWATENIDTDADIWRNRAIFEKHLVDADLIPDGFKMFASSDAETNIPELRLDHAIDRILVIGILGYFTTWSYDYSLWMKEA